MNKKMKMILISIVALIIIIFSTILVINYNKSNQEKSIGSGNSSLNGTITDSSSKSYAPDSIQPSTSIVTPNETNYDKQDPTKIIKKSNITMQTDNYDNSLKNINKLIDISDAMIVKMQENQGNIYNIMNTENSKSRTVEMTIKVSKDKFESFNTELKKFANVVSYYEEAQDISSSYSDIESKIDSYKLQEAQLNELLKKATAAKDLLEISNQTQNVIQQREYLQRQKDSYDNQIEYSTVTLKLTEVESIEIKEKSTFSRMEDTFKSSLSQIQEIFINIVMFVVYIIPYILIVLIILLIVYIIHRLNKKKN